MTANRRINRSWVGRRKDTRSIPLLSAWTTEFLEEIGWHFFLCAGCGESKAGPLDMTSCANCDYRSANRHLAGRIGRPTLHRGKAA